MGLGDIEFLNVKKITRFGAFMTWDGDQEILLPEAEQITDIKEDEKYLVIIGYDNSTDRYFASQRIDRYLRDSVKDGLLKKGQKVDIVVYALTPLGAKAAINKEYIGLLYKNEMFREVKLGEKGKAFIKNIREDRKIDLTLQQQGYRNVQNAKDKILNKLKEAGGFLPFNDKSSPESIREKFQVSKNVFKKTIGSLYKQQEITITKEGIKLS